MMIIREFSIRVSDDRLSDLRQRIGSTRWPAVPEADQESGLDIGELQLLSEYWREYFDWRAIEERLNSTDQVMSEISGTEIHCAIAPGGNEHALVLLHGWPSSFVEMMELLPALEPALSPAGVDILVPSLPGFGFSTLPGSRHRGFRGYAELLEELVVGALGYESYICHGSDWGAAVAIAMATGNRRPRGIHLTGALMPETLPPDESLSPEERAFLQRRSEWSRRHGAYFDQLRSSPLITGLGVEDSPVGLLGWLAAKHRAWSASPHSVGRDKILTNAMIYWVTRTFTSSAMIYADSQGTDFVRERLTVPTGMALFADDISLPPRSWLERFYEIVRFSQFPAGGHFPAYEKPDLLAADIFGFVGQVLSST